MIFFCIRRIIVLDKLKLGDQRLRLRLHRCKQQRQCRQYKHSIKTTEKKGEKRKGPSPMMTTMVDMGFPPSSAASTVTDSAAGEGSRGTSSSAAMAGTPQWMWCEDDERWWPRIYLSAGGGGRQVATKLLCVEFFPPWLRCV